MKKNTPFVWVAMVMALLVSCRKDILQSSIQSSTSSASLSGSTIIQVGTLQAEISKKVKIANPTGGDSLLAWLFIPATSVDVPAVVVLHGSGGLWKPKTNTTPAYSVMESQFTKWVDTFRTEKIAALFVDSYVSRGIPDDFANVAPPNNFHVAAEFVRPRDAYAGLAYLRAQSKIIDSKIGLLGFSHGGTSAVSTMVDSGYVHKATWSVKSNGIEYTSNQYVNLLNPAGRPAQGGFVAAVSYYPGLGFFSYYGKIATPSDGKYRSYAPILIHAAQNDDLYNSTGLNTDVNPNVQKRVYDAFREKAILNGCSLANGNALTMHVYTNANHGFDGKTTGADKDADILAKSRTLNFLKHYFNPLVKLAP
jgi:dienelactone hydrolase